jgi:hypothetical protein
MVSKVIRFPRDTGNRNKTSESGLIQFNLNTPAYANQPYYLSKKAKKTIFSNLITLFLTQTGACNKCRVIR